MTDTVAFVQEWLMSGDHEPTQWDRDFAAAIDARCKVASDAEATMAEKMLGQDGILPPLPASDTGAGLQSIIRDLMAEWPDTHMPSRNLCVRAAAALATDATGGATGGEVEGIQLQQFGDDREQLRWIIVEREGTWTIHTHSVDSVAPPVTYDSKRKVAARLLQLLHIGPVSPQTWPETACIGTIEGSDDA